MKKIFALIGVQCCLIQYSTAQAFQVDTLVYNGDANNYINLVVLGDGYTSAEQTNFLADANSLTSYLFAQVPWSNYINYFNVFAIEVISTQSGITHANSAADCNTAFPLVPVSSVTTHLDCTFDSYGIHRLVVPHNATNMANVLATNFPNYDQVLVIANSTYYGGGGGQYATSTQHTSADAITAHELGHSFGGLADEYYAGDIFASEKPNMTAENDPLLIKWRNWLGTNGVAINQHCCSGSSALWYKPHTTCKMQSLFNPYCSVCIEGIIEHIHSLVNPIVNYTPILLVIDTSAQFIDFKLTEVMKPLPNTLKTLWTLDGATVLNNVDSFQIDQNAITNGTHTLIASVTDTSALLRVDSHETVHFSSVIWTIEKNTNGINLTSDESNVDISVYPNPAAQNLTISMVLEKQSVVALQLVSIEGKVIRRINNNKMDEGLQLKTIDISDLTNGTYYIVVNINGHTHNQPFIKTD